jgi:hypothetical protein
VINEVKELDGETNEGGEDCENDLRKKLIHF